MQYTIQYKKAIEHVLLKKNIINVINIVIMFNRKLNKLII